MYTDDELYNLEFFSIRLMKLIQLCKMNKNVDFVGELINETVEDINSQTKKIK